jgi:hypothetical protein
MFLELYDISNLLRGFKLVANSSCRGIQAEHSEWLRQILGLLKQQHGKYTL